MPLIYGPPLSAGAPLETGNLTETELNQAIKILNDPLILPFTTSKKLEDSEFVNPFEGSDFPAKFEYIAKSHLQLTDEKISLHKQKLQNLDIAQRWATANIFHADYRIRNLSFALFLANTTNVFSNDILARYKEINNRHLKCIRDENTYYYNPILFVYFKVNYALLLLNQPKEQIINDINLICLIFRSLDKDMTQRKELRKGQVWGKAFFFTNLYSLGDSQDKQKFLSFREILEDNIQIAKNVLMSTGRSLDLIPPKFERKSQKVYPKP